MSQTKKVTGDYTIDSTTDINLTAASQVIVTGSPLRLASFTTTERDALSGVANGDLIYNVTLSKIQPYAGGAWVNLH